jgi:hypothetical protein
MFKTKGNKNQAKNTDKGSKKGGFVGSMVSTIGAAVSYASNFIGYGGKVFVPQDDGRDVRIEAKESKDSNKTGGNIGQKKLNLVASQVKNSLQEYQARLNKLQELKGLLQEYTQRVQGKKEVESFEPGILKAEGECNRVRQDYNSLLVKRIVIDENQKSLDSLSQLLLKQVNGKDYQDNNGTLEIVDGNGQKVELSYDQQKELETLSPWLSEMIEAKEQLAFAEQELEQLKNDRDDLLKEDNTELSRLFGKIDAIWQDLGFITTTQASFNAESVLQKIEGDIATIEQKIKLVDEDSGQDDDEEDFQAEYVDNGDSGLLNNMSGGSNEKKGRFSENTHINLPDQNLARNVFGGDSASVLTQKNQEQLEKLNNLIGLVEEYIDLDGEKNEMKIQHTEELKAINEKLADLDTQKNSLKLKTNSEGQKVSELAEKLGRELDGKYMRKDDNTLCIVNNNGEINLTSHYQQRFNAVKSWVSEYKPLFEQKGLLENELTTLQASHDKYLLDRNNQLLEHLKKIDTIRGEFGLVSVGQGLFDPDKSLKWANDEIDSILANAKVSQMNVDTLLNQEEPMMMQKQSVEQPLSEQNEKLSQIEREVELHNAKVAICKKNVKAALPQVSSISFKRVLEKLQAALDASLVSQDGKRISTDAHNYKVLTNVASVMNVDDVIQDQDDARLWETIKDDIDVLFSYCVDRVKSNIMTACSDLGEVCKEFMDNQASIANNFIFAPQVNEGNEEALQKQQQNPMAIDDELAGQNDELLHIEPHAQQHLLQNNEARLAKIQELQERVQEYIAQEERKNEMKIRYTEELKVINEKLADLDESINSLEVQTNSGGQTLHSLSKELRVEVSGKYKSNIKNCTLVIVNKDDNEITLDYNQQIRLQEVKSWVLEYTNVTKQKKLNTDELKKLQKSHDDSLAKSNQELSECLQKINAIAKELGVDEFEQESFNPKEALKWAQNKITESKSLSTFVNNGGNANGGGDDASSQQPGILTQLYKKVSKLLGGTKNAKSSNVVDNNILTIEQNHDIYNKILGQDGGDKDSTNAKSGGNFVKNDDADSDSMEDVDFFDCNDQTYEVQQNIHDSNFVDLVNQEDNTEEQNQKTSVSSVGFDVIRNSLATVPRPGNLGPLSGVNNLSPQAYLAQLKNFKNAVESYRDLQQVMQEEKNHFNVDFDRVKEEFVQARKDFFAVAMESNQSGTKFMELSEKLLRQVSGNRYDKKDDGKFVILDTQGNEVDLNDDQQKELKTLSPWLSRKAHKKRELDDHENKFQSLKGSIDQYLADYTNQLLEYLDEINAFHNDRGFDPVDQTTVNLDHALKYAKEEIAELEREANASQGDVENDLSSAARAQQERVSENGDDLYRSAEGGGQDQLEDIAQEGEAPIAAFKKKKQQRHGEQNANSSLIQQSEEYAEEGGYVNPNNRRVIDERNPNFDRSYQSHHEQEQDESRESIDNEEEENEVRSKVQKKNVKMTLGGAAKKDVAAAGLKAHQKVVAMKPPVGPKVDAPEVKKDTLDTTVETDASKVTAEAKSSAVPLANSRVIKILDKKLEKPDWMKQDAFNACKKLVHQMNQQPKTKDVEAEKAKKDIQLKVIEEIIDGTIDHTKQALHEEVHKCVQDIGGISCTAKSLIEASICNEIQAIGVIIDDHHE